MEEYLESQRRKLNFSAADAVAAEAVPPADKSQAPFASSWGRQPTYSPFSTISSDSSSDLLEFISELRQGYTALRHVREPGRITRKELGDLLFQLDQDLTEELLSELFTEIDTEGKGSVEFDTFLHTFQCKISDAPKAGSSAVATPLDQSRTLPRSSGPTPNSSLAASRSKAGPYSPCPLPIAPASASGWPPRPASTTSFDRPAEPTPTASAGSSADGRPGGGRKSKSQVLWWGFQDLADTL